MWAAKHFSKLSHTLQCSIRLPVLMWRCNLKLNWWTSQSDFLSRHSENKKKTFYISSSQTLNSYHDRVTSVCDMKVTLMYVRSCLYLDIISPTLPCGKGQTTYCESSTSLTPASVNIHMQADSKQWNASPRTWELLLICAGISSKTMDCINWKLMWVC